MNHGTKRRRVRSRLPAPPTTYSRILVFMCSHRESNDFRTLAGYPAESVTRTRTERRRFQLRGPYFLRRRILNCGFALIGSPGSWNSPTELTNAGGDTRRFWPTLEAVSLGFGCPVARPRLPSRKAEHAALLIPGERGHPSGADRGRGPGAGVRRGWPRRGSVKLT